MAGVFTCQPEGFDAHRAQNGVVNRLCRSLHGAFYSLSCIPNCVKRSRETYVNRTYSRLFSPLCAACATPARPSILHCRASQYWRGL